jgi:hypothetical protein
VAQLWADADRVAAKGRELRDVVANGKVASFTALRDGLPALEAEVDARLDAYGLVTCGSGFADL